MLQFVWGVSCDSFYRYLASDLPWKYTLGNLYISEIPDFKYDCLPFSILDTWLHRCPLPSLVCMETDHLAFITCSFSSSFVLVYWFSVVALFTTSWLFRSTIQGFLWRGLQIFFAWACRSQVCISYLSFLAALHFVSIDSLLL